MAVTTSLVVQFSQSSADSSGQLSAELDGRENGLNSGKTSFLPGDPAFFLVFKSDDVVIDSVESSAGQVSLIGPGFFEVQDEWVQFADTNEASVGKPITDNLTYQWYGASLGTVEVKGGKLVCQTKGVGMLKVSYRSAYIAYRLGSPATINGDADFQILVLVKGHN
jgi:hypothetical protein